MFIAVLRAVEAGLRRGVATRRLETRLGKLRDVLGGAFRPPERARRSTVERSMRMRIHGRIVESPNPPG
jgi:hypothetical protein